MELLSRLPTVWIVLGVVALTGARAGISVVEKRRPDPERRYKTAGEALESLIIAVVLVFLVIRPFIAQPFYIPSGSMNPTLAEDDRILVNKMAYRFGSPQRHEVVVFRAPRRATGAESDADETDFVKRVVGLPGDVVEIHGGVTYINGRPESSCPCREPIQYDLPPTVVPGDSLFVMGDNRNHSNDSHAWGPLKLDRVIGRAVCIFWPPSRAGGIR